MSQTIYTIGHSTRTFDEFVSILHAHKIQTLADVRTVPRSRRLPHFNDDALQIALPQAGIQYAPFKSLGGWRHALKDSINLGWRNESFRGYADYMQTPQFTAALDELMQLAETSITTTMCAEAVPWRCHRSLISDALLVRGRNVLDIMSATKTEPHKLTKFAKVEGTAITYPTDGEPTLFPIQ